MSFKRVFIELRMRKTVHLVWCIISVMMMAPFHCSQFPNSFEQVDDSKVRVLDFIYRNNADRSLSEGAPGDTMELTAVFAGEAIHNVTWYVSYDVGIEKGDLYPDFQDHKKPLNIKPLEHTRLPADSAEFGDNAHVEKLQFILPDTVMVHNKNISDKLFDSIGISREDFFLMLDSLIDKPFSRWLSLLGTEYRDSVDQFCEIIAQQLTMPVRIIAVVNETYEIYSDLNIRYNRLLNKQIPSVKANNNPRIRWAGIYKVKGSDKTRFNPCEMSPKDTFLCLYADDSSKMTDNSVLNDTLFIQNGYSYFVAVDSGIQGSVDLRDSGTILLSDNERLCSPETWFTQWFINLDSTTDQIAPENLPSIPSTRLMNIAFGAPLEQFIPPADHRIRSLDLWVQVFDSYAGERLRPYGSDLKALKIHFLYEDD